MQFDKNNRHNADRTELQREGTLRTLFDDLIDPMFLMDLDGLILECNKAFASVLGKTVQQLLQTNAYDLIPQSFKQERVKKVEKAVTTGKRLIFEDDRLGRYYRHCYYPISDASGKVYQLYVITQDITEQKLAEYALKQKEDRFKTFFERHSSTMLVIDPDTDNITDANKAAVDFYGWTFEELTSMHIDEINTHQPETTEKNAEAPEAIKHNRDVLSHRRKDGTIRDVEVFSAPIEIDGKELLYAIIHDVTERKLAEETLKRSEKRFKTLFHSHSAIQALLDPDTGAILEVNQEAANWYGWSIDELKQMYTKDINTLSPDAIIKSLQSVEGMRQNKFIGSHRRADGSIRDVEIFRNKIEVDGKPVIHVIIHDISERKRIENILVENQKRFRQALEATHAGVWDADLKTGDNIWSDEIWELYGLERGKEKPSHDLWVRTIHPDDRIKITQLVDNAVQKRLPLHMEYRVVHLDGSLHWVMGKGMPLFDKKGDAVRYIGTSLDITEHKLLEAEREALQMQLQHAQKMQLVGQLAGGIAHDFNNMLTVILGHTELALDKADSSYDDLEAIKKAATQSAELTRQLLAFARRRSLSAKTIDLNVSIVEMFSILKRLIGENIALNWIPKTEHAFVQLDPAQINQILANLCVNARDAIEKNGSITIETNTIYIDKAKSSTGHICRIPGDYITLTITDNGQGIDTEHLPHIMEPFFTTKEVGKGTGMGLATVYGIIKQSNGFIKVESEKGKGTTITIYLPLQGHDAVTESAGASKQPLPHGTGLILLVEDQKDILKLCRQILEDSGYHVLAAASPKEAIQLAEYYKDKIELLVTDVIMPVMNGSDLFKKLQLVCSDLKVLYMSGYTADFIAQNLCIDEGINVIEKPFSIAKLTKAVAKTLKAGKSHNHIHTGENT